jgi:Mg-chelatase subunit ChlD
MRISLQKAFIVISAITMLSGGSFPLLAQQAVEKEPNNSAEQANPIALNGKIEGFSNDSDDVDWYLLTIPAPGLDSLIIEVAGPPDIELALSFCDASGKELTEMDANRLVKGETIVRLRQAPGKFLIKVIASSGTDHDQPYTLTARKPDKPPATAEEVGRALVKALDYIASRQQEDGSWPDYEQAFTGLAIQAFIGGKCVARDYTEKVRTGLDFLRSKFTSGSSFPAGSEEAAKNGGLFDIQSSHQMYQQAIATLGVIEALVDLNDTALEPIAEEAVQLIIRAQNTENKPETLKGPIPLDSPNYGSWRYETDYIDGDVSVSAWQILTLRAAVNAGFTVPDRVFTAAAKYVRSMHGADGSFCYDAPTENGESCARAGMGALSLQLCGAPKDPMIPAAIRFMQDHGPTWNLEYPGNGYPFYYWYYATRVMYMAGGEDWRVWKDYMCRFLIDNQNEKGDWNGSRQEDSEDLEIYRTAFGALMLEFCCGHVPVYMSPPRRKVPAAVVVTVEKEAEAEAARTVEIIMDASNSMTGMVGKETKIAAARRVLKQTIEGLPDTMNVGLRVYGHRYATDDYDNACRDTELVVPIGPVDKAALVGMVEKIQTKGRTPLVTSVLAAIKDLEKLPNGSVVLVTDGIESCKGDIKSIAPAIKAAGLEIKVNIVGFDIKEAGGKQELESIAGSTGGRYIDARNAGELLAALEQALKLEYVVIDAAGKEAGRGAVGGDPIKLAPGIYTLRVLLTPQPVELKVTVKSGEQRGLTLKKSGGTWILE